MAETRIKWNDGEGYIAANYEGQGNGSLRFTSTTANTGLDREQTVQVAAKGAELEVEVTVRQTGLREELCTADAGNPGFVTQDGEVFAVLKQ